MTSKTLSQPALKIIENYLHLPFPQKDISCPYFNNRHAKVRGALRAVIGKGTPQDIVDEAQIFALKEKTDLEKLSNQDLKKFLVEHNLGVDCSGLVYHVLDTELQKTQKKSLKQLLYFPHAKNFIRKFLVKLRPAENCSVTTLANEKNTIKIDLKNVEPGDIIIILQTGIHYDYNHVLLIHKIDYEKNIPQKIYYTHSLQYPHDGKYNHGVRQEEIEVTNVQKSISQQNWKNIHIQEYIEVAEQTNLCRLSFFNLK